MNAEQVDRFEQVNAQLEGLYTEISLLSKSKPNDAINKFKLKFINLVLSSVNEILENDYRPFSDFNQFDGEEIPSNSDVVFMLSQYLNSMEKLRADNIEPRHLYWFWVIDDETSDLRTAAPRKILKK